MITDRDLVVANFIELIPCYSNTIQKIFFKSMRTCNRSLKRLYEYEYINRKREHASKYYFYWAKGKKEPADKHKRHYDLIARAYLWIDKKYVQTSLLNILNIEIQVKHGKVKPDIILYIEGLKEDKEGKKVITQNILPVEIERGNNIDNTINKYKGSEFKKLLLFSRRPYNKAVYFIEVVQQLISELEEI